VCGRPDTCGESPDVGAALAAELPRMREPDPKTGG
jgi:hypothetical protein